MPSKTVKYWKRIGPDSYEPHSTSQGERDMLIGIRGNEGWCQECDAVVSVSLYKFADGHKFACEWCHNPVDHLCPTWGHLFHENQVCTTVDQYGDPCCCDRVGDGDPDELPGGTWDRWDSVPDDEPI